MQYQPVCGARTVQCIKAPCHPVYETFGNRCMLDSADAIYIHDGECTESETGPYIPPAPKTKKPVKIAIDGVPLTTVHVDLSDTDTNQSYQAVESRSETEPKIISLWRGLWERVSDWLRM